jgi:WD40 repeat protein
MTDLWTCSDVCGNVAYSPVTNRFVAVTGAWGFDHGHLIKCYDLNTGKGVVLTTNARECEGQINYAGNRLITWDDKSSSLDLWDLDSVRKLFEVKVAGQHFQFSGDDSRIVSASGQWIYVWDAENGIQLLAIPVKDCDKWTLCCSPNGQFCASSRQECVVVADLHSGRTNVLMCPGNIIFCVCFDRCGRLFAGIPHGIVYWQMDNWSESCSSQMRRRYLACRLLVHWQPARL